MKKRMFLRFDSNKDNTGNGVNYVFDEGMDVEVRVAVGTTKDEFLEALQRVQLWAKADYYSITKSMIDCIEENEKIDRRLAAGRVSFADLAESLAEDGN